MRKLFFIIIFAIALGSFTIFSYNWLIAPQKSITTTTTTTVTTTTVTTTPMVEHYFPGWTPGDLGLAITSDGKKAYITFASDDALLVVNLSTFTVSDSINVSVAGNMIFSNNAVLSPDGKKLYVANPGARNVMIINAETKSVEKVLPITPLFAVAISMSQDGSKAYVTSQNEGLFIINTSNYSYNRILSPEVNTEGVIFGPVVPSPSNPDLLYTVGTLREPSGIFYPAFFVFNVSSNTVVRSSKLANEVIPLYTFARRLVINSNETTAYFGWVRMDDRGSGNFVVFDLNNFQVLASTPMENGVNDFAVNEKTGKIYIIGFWAGGGAPQELPIMEYDLSTNKVIRKIMVSPSSDQRAITLDPTNENYLYMTEGDFNLIRKVEISTGKEISRLKFNKADIRPYNIIRGDSIGYIISWGTRKIYKLDLRTGDLIGSIPLPDGASYAGGYYQDKLYFSGGRIIYSINPSDGSLIKRFDIGMEIQPLTLTFFNDKMATIDFEPGGMIGRRLLFFDAKNMSIIKSIDLPHEPHGDKVIVSPDGSKLYIARGQMMGTTTVVTVFNSSTLDVINTIEIPFIKITRRGATGFVEADFDETKRILYLTGFTSVYKIDMDNDKLLGILDLIDVYEMQNINGWPPTGLSGLVFSQTKDKMFVVSGDSHSMYTYDLVNSSWSTKITNLKGYFITDVVSSPDKHYLYTVNQQSDSVTMIDLTSGDVVRIIRL
jgi:YVTN family beta-propeller protein